MLQRTGVGVANPNASAARNAITCRPVSQDVSGFRPGLTGRRKTRSARDAGRSRREKFEFLLLGSPVRLVGHTTVCEPSLMWCVSDMVPGLRCPTGLVDRATLNPHNGG